MRSCRRSRPTCHSADMMDMVLKLNSYEMTDSVGWPYDDWEAGAVAAGTDLR